MTTAAGAMPATLQHVAGLPQADMSLPILEGVANRSAYRSRPEEETEEAHWYCDKEPDTLVEPQQVHLKSIHSKQSSVIVFKNKTPYRVRALWLDFKGDEVVYSVLEPKSTKRYHTYITHPWIMREVNSATRMLLSGRLAVVGMSTEQVVEVQAPPELTWSLDTHSCFPAPFKQSVQGLLLSHKKLERGAINPAAHATRDFSSPSFKRMACCSPGPAGLEASATPLSPRTRMTFAMAAAPAAADECGMPCSPKVAAQQLLSYTGSSAACLSPSRRPAAILGSATSAATSVALPGMPSRTLSPSDLAAASAITSICISTEAANFTATVTVTSPKRSMMMSTVNIAVNTALIGSSTTTINLGTTMGGAAALEAGAGAGAGARLEDDVFAGAADCTSKGAGRKGSKMPLNLFNNLMSNFKNLMKPKAASSDCNPATHFTLEVTHSPEQDISSVDTDCHAEADCVPWSHTGTHLGNLPSHLLAHIAELAAPTAYQSASMPAKGKPDILPILMACRPKTKEEEEQEALAAQQQQQQQENEDDGNHEMLALV